MDQNQVKWFDSMVPEKADCHKKPQLRNSAKTDNLIDDVKKPIQDWKHVCWIKKDYPRIVRMNWSDNDNTLK